MTDILAEKTRLYQAALEDRRTCRSEVGPGYQTDEERQALAHIDREVESARREMEIAWLGLCR